MSIQQGKDNTIYYKKNLMCDSWHGSFMIQLKKVRNLYFVRLL